LFNNKKHLIENGLFNLKLEEFNHYPGSLLFRGKYKYSKILKSSGSINVTVKINKDKESAWKLLKEYWSYRKNEPCWHKQVPAYIFIDGTQSYVSSFKQKVVLVIFDQRNERASPLLGKRTYNQMSAVEGRLPFGMK
jgi:hypothetical protein